MRRLFFSLLTLIFLAGCSAGSPQAQTTATPLPVPTAAARQTFTVARGDIAAQVQFSARMVPAVQHELYFRADGRVRKVYARPGDNVTQGQVLADLAQVDTMESQQKQQAFDLRRAEINLAMAELRQQMFATQTPNWTPGYEVQAKMENYQIELAQIALEETQLKSANLESALEDARIVSPMDGKVLTMSVLEGSDARVFTPLITVGDVSSMEIGAPLTTTQLQGLSEGLPAQITLPTRPGEKLAGTVRALPYPYGTGGGTTTEGKPAGGKAAGGVDNTARISLDDPAQMKSFKLGDLVTVTVFTERRENVLFLPPAAIRTYDGRNFVVIKDNNLQRRVDVKLGLKNEERVEILDGLEEGQVIIAP